MSDKKQIRNVYGADLTTDVDKKDGSGKVVIKAGQLLDEALCVAESLKKSLKDGSLKRAFDKKWIMAGAMIKGEAAKANKITAVVKDAVDAVLGGDEDKKKEETKPAEPASSKPEEKPSAEPAAAAENKTEVKPEELK